jgi:transmembrane sensor
MTSEHSQRRGHDHVWNLMSQVEHHPQVQAWLRIADEEYLAKQTLDRRRVPRAKLILRLAAAVFAAAAIGAGTLIYPRFWTQHYETHLGEQRDVLLADGSRITLNTNTLISVRYSSQRRYLVLERGEALFSVAHDVVRPFEVAAAGTLTRALETEFNVDLHNSRVTVSVLEGVVQVSTADNNTERVRQSPGNTAVQPLRAVALTTGQALEFHPHEQRHLVAEVADLGRIDAWRTRRLAFSNTPLAEAVDEFNRYSATQVVIGSPDLAAIRVSGVFRIGDTDGFLYSLHEVLGVEAHGSANEIVLVRAGD